MCEGKTLECWSVDDPPAIGSWREMMGGGKGHITNYKQAQKQQQFCTFKADHNPSLMMQGSFYLMFQMLFSKP